MWATLVKPAGAGRRYPAVANLIIFRVISILLSDKPTLNCSLPVRCRALIDRPRCLNRRRYLAVHRRWMLVKIAIVIARCEE